MRNSRRPLLSIIRRKMKLVLKKLVRINVQKICSLSNEITIGTK